MLPDLLPIQPFTRPVRGDVRLPGSKSITNRALMLAALCDGSVTLTGALFSDDTAIMAEALRQLGFQVQEHAENREIVIEGGGGKIPVTEAKLQVGLAGTAARFLTALCAAAPTGEFRIDGVSQMRKRPMRPLIEALRTLGADIRCPGEEGFFPLEIRARGLSGGIVEIDASESSQLLSALLMVAPLAKGDVTIRPLGKLRWPFVQMTSRLQQSFGQAAIARDPGSPEFTLEAGRPYRRPTGSYAIEPDASAASYFLALPLAVGGSLDFPGLVIDDHSLQNDVQFAAVLEKAGRNYRLTPLEGRRGTTVSFDAREIKTGVTADFSLFSDTFLTLAALAPLFDGPTRITGIAHTRKQETDRVAGMARELQRLGQDVVEETDALTITPRPLRAGQVIETYGDHRFAMSFGILGCHDLHGDGRPWLTVRDPACCAKTFPNFFELLGDLRRKSSGA
jgi:3-phosphoshikimate 1-carboxyvinyltransferase